ncbi:DnaJ subfamily B member 11 [Thelohanellus kitauei]|uniref:DnaJ subfamily B member 11 n=1 Tax=Thelohanellus kitauei TaxID=669202 RepID=A0A0C2MUV9_THEKT|nr:DnaJ subfamily B member 11 [Thelohanellus kitauei]
MTISIHSAFGMYISGNVKVQSTAISNRSFFNFGSFFDDDFEEHEPQVRRTATLVIPLFVKRQELGKKKLKILRVMYEKIASNKKRKCRCRMETHTEYFGPGSFRMSQRQVCDDCTDYEFKLKEKTIEVPIGYSLKLGQKLAEFSEMGEAHQDFETGDLEFIVGQIS